jgi:hypothetical protein
MKPKIHMTDSPGDSARDLILDTLVEFNEPRSGTRVNYRPLAIFRF